jgi:hypothetical protein
MLFPLREIKAKDMENALYALQDAALITLYVVDGHPYLFMNKWEKHQQRRSDKSKFPEPNENNCNQMISSDITCNQEQSNDIKCPRNRDRNRDRNRNTNTDSEPQKRFTPPTLEEITEYCKERNNGIDPQYFMDYQTARNWTLSNGKKMADWRATIRTWERNDFNRNKAAQNPAQDYHQRDYKDAQEDAFERMMALGG